MTEAAVGTATRARPPARAPYDVALEYSAARWGPRFVAAVILAWAATPVIGFRGALMALTALGMGAAVVGIWRPAIGLLGVGIVCVLDASSRVFLFTGGVLRYNTFNYWLLVVLILFAPAVVQMRNIHLRLALGLLLLLGAELAISRDIPRGVEHVLNGMSVIGLTIYFARVAGGSRIWYWLAVQSGTLAALGGLAFQLSRDSLPRIDPNAWSSMGVTALFGIALGYRHTRAGKPGQPILLALAAASLLWVFLSGSRGNTLIAVGCAWFLLIMTRGMGRRVIGACAAVLVGLIIWTQFPSLNRFASHRVEKLLDTDASLSSRTSGRSDLVRGGVRLFSMHPLGVGTGGFAPAWRDLTSYGFWVEYGRGVEKDSHSAWIKVLVENGVPGFVMLAVYVLSFAGASLRRRDAGLWRLGLLVSFAIGVAFLTTEFQSKGVWFLAAGGSVAISSTLVRGGGRAGLLARRPLRATKATLAPR